MFKKSTSASLERALGGFNKAIKDLGRVIVEAETNIDKNIQTIKDCNEGIEQERAVIERAAAAKNSLECLMGL